MAETPKTDLERSADAENNPAPFMPPGASAAIWANLAGVDQAVSLVLGTTEVPLGRTLDWTEGSLIELSKVSGEPVDVLVNGRLCFRGEVVSIANNFGVRITEIVSVPGEG